MPFSLDAAFTLLLFLHVYKDVSTSSWVWPVFRLCILLLYKSLLKRRAWGPLWLIRKKQNNMQVYFPTPKGWWKRRCCLSRPTTSNPVSPSPLGWFPLKDATFLPYSWLQSAGTRECQWKIFLWKHTVEALLCGKNVNFSVFKRRGGAGGW